MRRFRCRFHKWILVCGGVLLSIGLVSCEAGRAPATGRGVGGMVGPVTMHAGLSAVEAPDPGRVAAGQTIYVPAYSSIFISDRADRFDLAITLAVRNTDPARPIVLTKVQYVGGDGQVVREYLDRPIQIAPLASAAFFVAESDAKGGSLTSFMVRWVAEQRVDAAPIANATMVGVSGTQGVSFVCEGRVIQSIPADREAR